MFEAARHVSLSFGWAYYASRGSSQLLFSFVLRHYHYGLKGRDLRYSLVNPSVAQRAGASVTMMKTRLDHRFGGHANPVCWLMMNWTLVLSGSKTLSHEFWEGWQGDHRKWRVQLFPDSFKTSVQRQPRRLWKQSLYSPGGNRESIWQ